MARIRSAGRSLAIPPSRRECSVRENLAGTENGVNGRNAEVAPERPSDRVGSILLIKSKVSGDGFFGRYQLRPELHP